MTRIILLKACASWLIVCLSGVMSTALAAGEHALWDQVRSGDTVVLLRHALAPGTGDPVEFDLADCSTQRNLSDKGRDQARRIGEQFRQNGITSARVYTSQWCRCTETAELLNLGTVEPLPIINSFFRNFDNGGPQTDALIKWLSARPGGDPTVLVSHQVNITALTGVYPRSGEMVIVRMRDNGEIEVAGTIRTD